MLLLARVRLEIHLEEPEPGLLVRADRRGVAPRRSAHAELDPVARECHIPQERAYERSAVTLSDEVGLSDEEIDTERSPAEGDHRRVFGMVVDPVALKVPDRTAV